MCKGDILSGLPLGDILSGDILSGYRVIIEEEWTSHFQESQVHGDTRWDSYNRVFAYLF